MKGSAHISVGPRRRWRRPPWWAALVFLAFLGCGCPSRSPSEVTSDIHRDYFDVAPRSIAVLPFDNMSTDLDATPLVRPVVAGRLRYKGYDVPNLDWVDEVLQENGAMVSHDVYGFSAGELGEILGVDAVMFGVVTDFTTKYAVVYASVAVQLRLELVDCRTGEVLWHNEARAAENTAVESILTLLMYHEDLEKGLKVVAAGNAIWAVLESFRPYAERAAAMTLATLPPGYRGARSYPENYDQANTKALIYQSIIITSPP